MYCVQSYARIFVHRFSEHSKFVTLVNEEVPEDGEEGYSEEGTRLVGRFLFIL